MGIKPNKRVPVEYVNLVRIRYLIDKRSTKYYKVGIFLNLNYRSFLDRLNGRVRFKCSELVMLADFLNVELSEITLCDICTIDDVLW